eukprot:TRINITY_DN77529_c0_g1_i1.p1 TRINITY_DN77529_c0_g1~~TRINITY_DN77529_c0_g1_i1.p1  ORF type:complete len:284 (+),score=52.83 TRINITY_DN77529_c0_g1_i1:76-852(+)
MAMCPGDTTQWEDIHRKLGNFAPKKKEPTNNEIEKIAIEAIERIDPLDHCTVKELDRLEDDVEEDNLLRYRRQRIAELKSAQASARFGTVLQVSKCDFVREVTDASANGQWVLVLLYVEARSACHYMLEPWVEAARRFPAVKFMRGIATQVVPSFPDASTPAVLVYRNSDCEKQIIGLDEWGGPQCNADCIEWVLSSLGAVETELEEDPRQRSGKGTTASWHRRSRRRDDESDEDEDADETSDRCYSTMHLGRHLRRA